MLMDFNEKLRDRAVPKGVTVQRVCRYAKDQKEVREILEAMREKPEQSEEISEVVEKNREVYEFEKILEGD